MSAQWAIFNLFSFYDRFYQVANHSSTKDKITITFIIRCRLVDVSCIIPLMLWDILYFVFCVRHRGVLQHLRILHLVSCALQGAQDALNRPKMRKMLHLAASCTSSVLQGPKMCQSVHLASCVLGSRYKTACILYLASCIMHLARFARRCILAHLASCILCLARHPWCSKSQQEASIWIF